MQADGERSIYRQIADIIEDGIVTGAYPEEEQVPSTNTFARTYRINPATAGKGFAQLVDEGVLYKRRGMGMYVQSGARERLINRRKEVFFTVRLRELVEEAKRLNIGLDEIHERLRSMKDISS